MDHSERIFRKQIYTIAGCGAGLLLALVWVYIKGGLSPRGFGVACLIWSIAMFASLFSVVRSRQRSAEGIRRKQVDDGIPAYKLDRDRCIKNIRSMKGLIAMFAVFFGYGMLSTQGKPLLPRAVGATVDLAILSSCVLSLFRSQKKLRELNEATASASIDEH